MVGVDLEGGRYFFNGVREGDNIVFASDDENECHLWVMAMYRATGQSHKPTPPVTLQDKNSTISKIQGGNNLKQTKVFTCNITVFIQMRIGHVNMEWKTSYQQILAPLIMPHYLNFYKI